MQKIQQKKIPSEIMFRPYDSSIPEVFEKVKRIIQEELPNVKVEHIGSSSIPGMGGSNVIDMVIVVEESSHQDIVEHVKAIGFIDSPFNPRAPVKLKQFTGSVSLKGKDHFIILYIETPDSEILKRWIKFREYMRQHPEKVKEYEEIKNKGIAEGEGRHMPYQQVKRPWINSLVDKILNDQK
jgi:GrpB-like predicted nucleotidyltransferase (UPF0157 family)